VKQCLGLLELETLERPASVILDIEAASHHERLMRITLTIDDDVATALRRLRRIRKTTLNQIVHEALRRGVRDMTLRKRRRAMSRTQSVNLGSLLIPSLDNIGEVLAAAEGKVLK
jgi:Arc/MetJ family transcription regulator